MTEPLTPKPTPGEGKPRYEPPQIVDLNGMAQAQGGTVSTTCQTGTAAGGSCLSGRAPASGCQDGGVPTTGGS